MADKRTEHIARNKQQHRTTADRPPSLTSLATRGPLCRDTQSLDAASLRSHACWGEKTQRHQKAHYSQICCVTHTCHAPHLSIFPFPCHLMCCPEVEWAPLLSDTIAAPPVSRAPPTAYFFPVTYLAVGRAGMGHPKKAFHFFWSHLILIATALEPREGEAEWRLGIKEVQEWGGQSHGGRGVIRWSTSKKGATGGGVELLDTRLLSHWVKSYFIILIVD